MVLTKKKQKKKKEILDFFGKTLKIIFFLFYSNVKFRTETYATGELLNQYIKRLNICGGLISTSL